MKTKNNPRSTVKLKLLLALPVILLVLVTISSCAAKKKAVTIRTEIVPPPPPPPQAIATEAEPEPFTVVEQMPMYPGGNPELLKFIAENTRYPLKAKTNNIQGKVIVRFSVTSKGDVNRISVLKSVDPELDAEAVRVVSTIRSFQPGQQGGKAVPVWYMLPITFTLKSDIHQRPPRFEIIGTDTVYSYTKEMPRFPGGNDAIGNFKVENMKYPPDAKSLGIEGAVMVRFLIEKNGSVSDVRILQGASSSLDAEAIRVTKLMPVWQPGKENGKPVKCMTGTVYEFLLTPRTPQAHNEGEPFVVVEEMPLFPGGDSTLLKYITQNTKYPESAKTNNIQGRVIIRFCITSKGGIDKISVIRGVTPELDAEAVRVVSTLPAFKPGKQGGVPVDVWYMVPISFALDNPAVPTSANLSANTPPPPPPPSGYDELPVFKGGETAMYKFIYSNLTYPQTAREKKISGKVNLRFSIDTDGSIGSVSVEKGVDPLLDGEAVRVIKLLPKWEPGKLAGTPVKVWYPVTVTFTLK